MQNFNLSIYTSTNKTDEQLLEEARGLQLLLCNNSALRTMLVAMLKSGMGGGIIKLVYKANNELGFVSLESRLKADCK